MIMKGCLPNPGFWGRNMDFSGHIGLVLPNNGGNRWAIIAKAQNGMNMIGHDDILVNSYVGKMVGNCQNSLFCNLAPLAQFFTGSKNTILFVGADRDKVIIWRRVVVARHPWAFPRWKPIKILYRHYTNFLPAQYWVSGRRGHDPALQFTAHSSASRPDRQ